MSIDERGQRAGTDLRAKREQVDVEGRLDDLFVTVRRRRRVGAVVAVAAVAAVIVGAGVVVQSVATQADPPPTTSPDQTVQNTQSVQCNLAFVQCQSDRRFTVQLSSTEMTWQLPPAFDRNMNPVAAADGNTGLMVESYRTDGSITAGVTVAGSVEGARRLPDESGAVVADRRAPTGAQGLATWVSQRPFFRASTVRSTSVDGRDAWTVETRMRNPHAGGPTSCANSRFSCTPVLLLADSLTGYFIGSWESMISRYTFVNLPRGQTAVIWSWSFSGEKDLEGNEALVDTIQFVDD
jgi:hypothetical protein